MGVAFQRRLDDAVEGGKNPERKKTLPHVTTRALGRAPKRAGHAVCEG